MLSNLVLKVAQSHCSSSIESPTGQLTVLVTQIYRSHAEETTAGDVWDPVLLRSYSRLLFPSVVYLPRFLMFRERWVYGQSVPGRGHKILRAWPCSSPLTGTAPPPGHRQTPTITSQVSDWTRQFLV